MTPDDLKNIEWLEPWHPYKSTEFEAELKREVGRGHQLFGRQVVCVGRRYDCDDVLFFLPESTEPLAVVHLTWLLKTERDTRFPTDVIYVIGRLGRTGDETRSSRLHRMTRVSCWFV